MSIEEIRYKLDACNAVIDNIQRELYSNNTMQGAINDGYVSMSDAEKIAYREKCSQLRAFVKIKTELLNEAAAKLSGGGGGANLTSLDVNPSTSAQHITPSSPYDGYNEVNVSAVTSAIDANISQGNIKKGVSILGVEGSVSPATLEVEATTVRYDATHTENVASNDNIRIRGNNGHDYTLAEWNAMFVAAGYNKGNMTVEPIGFRIQANAYDGVFVYKRFLGKIYNASTQASSTNQLSIGMDIMRNLTYTATGTDIVTNKSWSITKPNDCCIISESNTGCSWTIPKNYKYIAVINEDSDIETQIYARLYFTEWLRHRFAIDSGMTTTKANGTYVDIEIFNANGTQAAVDEDMYFWIKNDSNVWTNTNILAKYNLNNKHNQNSIAFTQAIADAIYNAQKTNGVNMNDTGVNSRSKPILVDGAKGAEAFVYNGKIMIITPYVSNPYTTMNSMSNNQMDSPATYWLIHNHLYFPHDKLLWAVYCNKTIIRAMQTYLSTRELWPDFNDNLLSVQIVLGCNGDSSNTAGVSLYNGNMTMTYNASPYTIVGALPV